MKTRQGEKSLPGHFRLVEASAGTGKTYYLEHCFLDCIIGKGIGGMFVGEPLDLSRIMVVTYTEKATRELRSRLRERLLQDLRGKSAEPYENREAILRACHAFDHASIHTLHSFCQRILKEFAFENRAVFDRVLGTTEELLEPAVLDFFRDPVFKPSHLSHLLPSPNQWPKVLESLKAMLATGCVHPRARSWDRRFEPGEADIPLKRLLAQCDSSDEALRVHLDAFLKNMPQGEALEALLTETQNFTKAFSYNRKRIRVFFSQLQDGTYQVSLSQRIEDILALKGLGWKTVADTPKINRDPRDAPREFRDLAERWDRILEMATLVRDLLQTIHWKTLFDLARFTTQRVEAWKNEQGGLTYADMILEVHDALNGPGGIGIRSALRRRYQVVFIDEFQDTNSLQWQIFHQLFLDGPGDTLVLSVGDPKQSIYRFQEADLPTYLAARSQAEQLQVLNTNYRSAPRLVEALNTLIADGPLFDPETTPAYAPVKAGRREGNLRVRNQEPPPVTWLQIPEDLTLNRHAALIRAVVLEITDLLTQGRILDAPEEAHALQGGDIAILVRRNSDAERYRAALREAKIACVISQDRPLFDTREASDWLRILEAMENPTDATGVKRALLTGFFMLSFKEVAALPEASLATWQEKFGTFREYFEQGAFGALWRALFEAHEFFPKQIQKSTGTRCITHACHLLEWIQEEQGRQYRPLRQWIRHFHQWLAHPPSDLPARLDHARDAVQILTMHKAKGLEFPVVFVDENFKAATRLAPGTTPCFHEGETRVYDFERKTESVTRHLEEDAGENRRLLYVAVTRAREKLYLPLVPCRENASRTLLTDLLWGCRVTARERLDYLAAMASRSLFDIKPLPTQAIPPPCVTPDVTDALREIHCRIPGAGIAARRGVVASFSSLCPGRDPRTHEKIIPLETVLPFDEPHAEISDEPFVDLLDTVSTPGDAAAFGNLVHQLLEHTPFEWLETMETLETWRTSPQALALTASILPPLLGRYGFGEAIRAPLLELLWHVLKTDIPVPGGTFQLCRIGRRKHEMEFLFRCRPPTQAGVAPVHTNYLRGSIDLVFEFQGKLYIADWKTNRLGNGPEAFTPEAMERAMKEHHYEIQHQIYTSALLQWMALQKKPQDIENAFGGVYYFFVRGMRQDLPRSPGIYFHRSDPEALRELAAGHLPDFPL